MRCLVADDDALVRMTVREFAEKMPSPLVVEEAATARDALSVLGSGRIDCLFLDLELPDMSGRDLLDLVEDCPPVVIISGHEDFGAASYEYGVVDYLVKPLKFKRFAEAVRRVEGARRDAAAMPGAASEGGGTSESGEIFVRDGGSVVRIQPDRLLFLRAESNYVLFQEAKRSHLVLASLKRLESALPPDFLRVHRSFIVNRRQIDRVEGSEIWIGEHRIPVSEGYRAGLLRALKVVN